MTYHVAIEKDLSLKFFALLKLLKAIFSIAIFPQSEISNSTIYNHQN